MRMGSVETLRVFPMSAPEGGGSQELYGRDEVGTGEEGENEGEREKHKASKRTFRKPDQPQPQQLSQSLEKNNPNK